MEINKVYDLKGTYMMYLKKSLDFSVRFCVTSAITVLKLILKCFCFQLPRKMALKEQCITTI